MKEEEKTKKRNLFLDLAKQLLKENEFSESLACVDESIAMFPNDRETFEMKRTILEECNDVSEGKK